MMRGQYDKPGEKVEPNTPASCRRWSRRIPKARATRLDLAHWLVSPGASADGPRGGQSLLAAVLRHRPGQSSADFGAQGELPSHPELLDYLAIWFRENGWDMKALVRLMLTSATFRQSSKVTPELLKRDPDNRLYARGPRFRLDAEQIRDNALFVSGLINLEMGGRGVETVSAAAHLGTGRVHRLEHDELQGRTRAPALYRRSLYTFLKRTAPPPYLANFDAPNRESLCGRRERSNTPLQALQLMNDVQHFEAARNLAERMIADGGKTMAERIGFAYRVVLARRADGFEQDIVQKTLWQYLDRYQKDVEAAKKAVRVGESPLRPGLAEPELAAYTLIANLILNLDETLMRN